MRHNRLGALQRSGGKRGIASLCIGGDEATAMAMELVDYVDPGARLRDWWAATGASVPTRPAPEPEVEALERRYGVVLPDDFRRFLLSGAPAGEAHEWDERNTFWWPLDRIRNIPDETTCPVTDNRLAAVADKYLIFADFMIWAWAWAICCTDDADRGRVAIVGSSPDRIVADSFSEFVDRYISNDWGSLI